MHRYAAVAGVMLAALGLGGEFGLWYLRTESIALYLFTAALLFYAGFSKSARKDSPAIVGGLGVLYLFSGSLLAVTYALPSFPTDAYEGVESVVRLTVGTLSVLAALYLPADSSSTCRSPAAEEDIPDDPEEDPQQ